MKNYKYLIIAPLLFLTTGCGSNLPNRKDGSFCNVTFVGHHVDCIDCPTYAPIGQDLKLKLDIHYDERDDAKWLKEPNADEDGVLDHPNIEYTVSIEDIHVTIGGEEYPKAFTFYYRNNGDNLLTIKKEYMVNDVTIEVTGRPRPNLIMYGYELGDEIKSRWYDSDNRDLYISFKTPYQQIPYSIRLLSGLVAFPVFEHDDIDVTFEVDKNAIEKGEKGIADLALPYDLRFRCNARYTYEGLDYFREYSEPFGTFIDENGNTRIAYAKCHFYIPHYIVNDHGSFRQFGTE